MEEAGQRKAKRPVGAANTNGAEGKPTTKGFLAAIIRQYEGKGKEKMKRMRTATGVLQIIQQEDPGSEITLHLIRTTIHSGAVPVVEVGRRKLVDADELIEYLTTGTCAEKSDVVKFGKIRRVCV